MSPHPKQYWLNKFEIKMTKTFDYDSPYWTSLLLACFENLYLIIRIFFASILETKRISTFGFGTPTLRIITPAVALLPLASGCGPVPSANPNSDIVDVARSYGDGGGYNIKWAGSGTPEEIRFKNERILDKGIDGTYCCGYTFAVAVKVAEQRGLLAGKSAADIRTFQKQWYGVNDQSGGTLCVYAVEQLGIGSSVEHDDAQPGDMVQFWRNNDSGHSVMFLSWAEENGQRIGFNYRSSQSATDGIGDHVEYFSDAGQGGKVLRERTHLCRLNPRSR
jgi:hypothetical protein